MPKRKRPPPIKIAPRAAPRRPSREFRNQVLVVGGFIALLAVVAGIIGFAFFQDYWEENVDLPNSRALQVGETTFDLDYFGRRMELFTGQFGAQGQVDFSQVNAIVGLVVGLVEQEELVRQRAGPDLGITASTAEIEQQISDRLGFPLDDRERFDQAYKGELERSGLSDREYWEMTRASVLSQKLTLAFNNAVPATLEQVSLAVILTTAEEADKVVERLDEGEEFEDLARELSQDEATKEEGGKREWAALDELRQELGRSEADEVSALEVGAVSDPIETSNGFLLFKMLDRESARDVSESQRSALGSRYYGFWVEEQRTLLGSMDFVRSDPDKLRWVVDRAFDL